MHRVKALLTGVMVSFLLAGCWSRETPVEQGNRAQILHRSLGADIADLDPHLVTGLPEFNVVTALFEGLVTEDPHDLHPVPGVAERWDISSDLLTYTFHLRADARWSNGDPVRARDFVNSFRRVLSPELGADYAASLTKKAGHRDRGSNPRGDANFQGPVALASYGVLYFRRL